MTQLVKYPKTMHLPWSPGLQNDDRLIESLDGFVGKRVIVTEKLDGENTTMYHDAIHARSVDGRHHPSRDWVKAFHGSIKHLIHPLYRICGENVYAEHSIHYKALKTYFYGFSLWDNLNNVCEDWEYTTEVFTEIGVTCVPVLFDGLWEDFLEKKSSFDDMVNFYGANDKDACEGYVVRVAHDFHMNDFQKYVAKFVRKGHVQTDEHWMAKPVIPNGLKKND